MNNMNKFFLLVLSSALLLSCSDSEKGDGEESTIEISGYIAGINDFGQPVPSFSPQEMKDKGFAYGDLLRAKIGDDISIDSIPFLTSFNEAGCFEPSFVDYNGLGDDYGFGLLNSDFHLTIGGTIGDKVIVTLTEKGGYKETYDLLKSTYPVERREDETAEQYANFRMIATTGIGNAVLYRGSNPLNSTKNPGRYSVADSLACAVGINTEIDLADTPSGIDLCLSSDGYFSTYCPQLYRNGNTMACGLTANIFSDGFKAKMGDMVKFMTARRPPYLLHCNEGKDRCGFVAMLLEAFMGGDVEELRSDYMITMYNFYRTEKGSDSYLMRQSIAIDRMIWVLCHEETLDSLDTTDWDTIDVTTLGRDDLRQAATNYFKAGGASDEDLEQLRQILSAR